LENDLRMAISKTAKTLLILGSIFAALILVAVIGIVLILNFSGKASVANNSVLVLKITGDLPDYSAEDPTAQLFGMGQPQSFATLLSQIRKAKADSRLGAVLLDVQFPGIGWGKAEELRAAILDLKASGKPVFAYMEMGSNKEYYIASAAEKIFLPPSGDLNINGFAANAMFYRGSLDKLGVEPEFIQIGKYKNAPDQYMRKDMAEGQREVLNSILDDLMNRYTVAISDARKKTPEDVKAIIDNAPYNAPKAKALGLIDDALYRDQVYDELKSKLGYKADDKLRIVTSADYRDVTSESLGLNKGEEIAVIYASGGIVSGRSSSGGFGGGEVSGSDTVAKAVNDAAADTAIKAIVLRVDSPGGSALASDIMWHAIENAKAKKPIVVSMSDYAASGGYYIACNANKIVAQESTLTGSIGVFMGKMSTKGLYEWTGVSNEYVLRGKNAGIFRESEKWTPEERAKMEEQTKSIYYDNFVPKVAKGRGKTVEEVDSIAQGHVWTGLQGKKNGLVDEIGGMEKAIEIAKQLANLPAEKEVRRVVFPEPKPFLETFFESTSASVKAEQQKAMVEALPKDAQRALRYAWTLEQMSQGNAMLMLPFELEIK
jgi:protease IV